MKGPRKIKLVAECDKAFARIAQNALVNNTILPSSYKTPPYDCKIKGIWLIPVKP